MMTLCSKIEALHNLAFAMPTANVRKAVAVVTINNVMIAKLENGEIMTSAKDWHRWAFLPQSELLMREPVVRGLAKLGVITDAEADAHMEEHRLAKEAADRTFATDMVKKYAPIAGIALPPELVGNDAAELEGAAA